MTRRLFPVLLVVIAALPAAGCWRTVVDKGPPPETIVSAGCPFEGCHYRDC